MSVSDAQLVCDFMAFNWHRWTSEEMTSPWLFGFSSAILIDIFSSKGYTDGLVQERRNSSALAMELHLSYTKPLIWNYNNQINLEEIMSDFVLSTVSADDLALLGTRTFAGWMMTKSGTQWKHLISLANLMFSGALAHFTWFFHRNSNWWKFCFSVIP